MTSCLSVFTEKSREARQLAVDALAGDIVAVGSPRGLPPDDDGSDDNYDHPVEGDGSHVTGQMESRDAKKAKKDDNARTCGLASPFPMGTMGIAGWEGMIPDDALTLSRQELGRGYCGMVTLGRCVWLWRLLILIASFVLP